MVGDDDQSIYSFRNAKPEYLIQFQQMFPNTQIMRLERNYRSSGSIIEASNRVIEKNTIRNIKTMFTTQQSGAPISLKICENPFAEADWVAEEIENLVNLWSDYKDCAILFRKKVQSRAIERALLSRQIPYTVIGTSFYDRATIKDVLSFFKLKANPKDDIAFKRVLSQCPGFGKKTVEKMLAHAKQNRENYIQCLGSYPLKPKLQLVMEPILDILNADVDSAGIYLQLILEKTAKKEMYESLETEDNIQDLKLIEELTSIIRDFEKDNPISLDDFLSSVSLQTDQKTKENGVVLMTIHSAKGLEFDNVFVLGVEEGTLPIKNALKSENAIEEERRLMYVAMTRAKENLYLTRCLERMNYSGITENCHPSRFLNDIPSMCLNLL